MNAFGSLLTLLAVLLIWPAQKEIVDSFRSEKRASNNAVFAFLMLTGQEVDYEECLSVNDEELQTFADMRKFCGENRMELELVKATPDQLLSHSLPLLVHVDGDSPRAGRFFIMFDHDDSRILLIDCSVVSVVSMDRERFFRQWSGVMATVTKRQYPASLPMWVLFLLAVTISFVFSDRVVMKASRVRRLFLAVIVPPVLLVPALSTGTAYGNDSGKLKAAVREVTLQNASSMKVMDLEFEVKHDYENPALPRPELEQDSLYLENGRLSLEYTMRFSPKFNQATQVNIERFDGDVFYSGSVNSGFQQILTKSFGEVKDHERCKYQSVRDSYLLYAGYPLPARIVDWGEGAPIPVLNQLFADAREIEIVAESEELVTVRVLVPEPVEVAARSLDLDEYERLFRKGKEDPVWRSRMESLQKGASLRNVLLKLDVRKGFAILERSDSTEDGKMIEVVTCSQHEKVDESAVWLPKTCVVEKYVKLPQTLENFCDRPFVVDTVSVKRMSFKSRSDRPFSVSEPAAGSSIVDRSTKAAVNNPDGETHYQQPANLDELQRIALNARRRTWGIVAVNVVVFLVLGGLLWWRKSRVS